MWFNKPKKLIKKHKRVKKAKEFNNRLEKSFEVRISQNDINKILEEYILGLKVVSWDEQGIIANINLKGMKKETLMGEQMYTMDKEGMKRMNYAIFPFTKDGKKSYKLLAQE
jgi:hypothetical protein